MKFSQFYSLLKKEIPDCRALQGNDCELYSFKPVNVASRFEDGLLYALYLPEDGFAPASLLLSGQSFILSGTDIQFDHLKMADRDPGTNILFVTGYTLVNLFNIISDIFYRENRFTSQLHDLYGITNSGAGLQVLIDSAQEMLGCPIVVMDNSYRIMAISLGNLREDAQGLHSQQEMGNITEHNLRRMKRDKIYEQLRKARGRMMYSKAPDADIWWVNMLVTVHGIEVAEIGVQEVGRKFDEYDFRFIRFLRHMIAHELQRNSYLHSDFGASHAILLRELIEGRFVSEEIAERRAKLLGWKTHPYYFMLTVYAEGNPDNITQKTYEIFVHNLTAVLPYCRWRITDENLVLLIPRPNNSLSYFRELEALEEVLKVNHFRAILSNPFSSLMEVKKAYDQTIAIRRLRGVISDPRAVWFYIDHTLLHMADLLRENHDLSEFCHPYIQDIYDYDAKHGTDFLATLKEYLTNINNPGLCAANLHIHKNTLYYRINKISDLFDLDLNNGDLRMRLQLSLELLKMRGSDGWS